MNKRYFKAKQAGISNVDIFMVKETARKSAEKMEKQAIEKAFLLMLSIPLNVLVNDYWEKSAKKRIPKFIDDVISLYESLENGSVSYGELYEMLEEYSGIKLEAEWLTKRKNGEQNKKL